MLRRKDARLRRNIALVVGNGTMPDNQASDVQVERSMAGGIFPSFKGRKSSFADTREAQIMLSPFWSSIITSSMIMRLKKPRFTFPILT